MGKGESGSKSITCRLDKILPEIVEDRVVDLPLETVVEEHRIVTLVVAEGGCHARADEGGVVDGWGGIGRIVRDRSRHPVPLAAVVVA